jgi:hypothetical protein
MFNAKLYTTFNLLFIAIFFFWNNCDFKEIIIPRNLEIENCVLGLERDVYLSVVKLLDSPNIRKVWVSTCV